MLPIEEENFSSSFSRLERGSSTSCAKFDRVGRRPKRFHWIASSNSCGSALLVVGLLFIVSQNFVFGFSSWGGRSIAQHLQRQPAATFMQASSSSSDVEEEPTRTTTIPNNRKKKAVVIGAGWGGLSAAYKLSETHDVTVIDAASRVGGLVRDGFTSMTGK